MQINSQLAAASILYLYTRAGKNDKRDNERQNVILTTEY